MKDIFERNFHPIEEVHLRRDLSLEEDSLSASLDAWTFLPNPVIHLYVYPHLSQPDEVPIPGYWTLFKLFEREHIALPGEHKTAQSLSD